MNAAVPTDLIEDGRLKINAAGKPELNWYVFDAVVFLNPEYARESTTKFFQQYMSKGGKLLLEGTATHDFGGKDIAAAWQSISSKAIANSFSLDNVAKLGVEKSTLTDGVMNEPGSFTFTNAESLENNIPAEFTFSYQGDTYTGKYKGLAAIKINPAGKLEKLAATGFTTLSKNGKLIMSSSSESDVFYSLLNGRTEAILADQTRSVRLTLYK